MCYPNWRSFQTSFKEHLHAIHYNKFMSGSATHILNRGLKCNDDIHSTTHASRMEKYTLILEPTTNVKHSHSNETTYSIRQTSNTFILITPQILACN